MAPFFGHNNIIYMKRHTRLGFASKSAKFYDHIILEDPRISNRHLIMTKIHSKYFELS